MMPGEYSAQITAIIQNAMTAMDHSEVSTRKQGEAAGLLKVVSEALTTARLAATANIQTLDEIINQLQGLESQSLTLLRTIGSFELAREKMNTVQQNITYHIDQIDAQYTVFQVGTINLAMKDSRAAFFDGTESLREYVREVE